LDHDESKTGLAVFARLWSASLLAKFSANMDGAVKEKSGAAFPCTGKLYPSLDGMRAKRGQERIARAARERHSPDTRF
jgi:hypothetical protein